MAKTKRNKNRKKMENAKFNAFASANTKAKPKENNNNKNGERKLAFCDVHSLEQLVLAFIRSNEPAQELLGMDNVQRKKIHFYARAHGLKTRSRNINGERVLTITRGENTTGPQVQPVAVPLEICPAVKATICTTLYELEKKNLQPLPQQRIKSVLQGGGLVGTPRIPPHARPINHSLTAERRELPIYQRRRKILDILDTAQVLIVNGATGSGKSTQLPQYLLEQASAYKRPVRILVSQPRRIAAISLSARIAEERGEQLGDTVGYIIRMESKYSSKTSLAFTTSGCLLRSLTINSSKFFNGITHLIIDEVHDRDLNTDFLLLAIKQELMNNKMLKVILMSATMDLVALSRYFGHAPVVDVQGRSFNVRVYTLEQILHSTGYMTPQMESILEHNAEVGPEPSMADLLDAYMLAHSNPGQDIDHALILSLLQMLLLIGQKGAVIVYLPGYQDMTKLMDHLTETLPTDVVKVMLLHSQVDSQQQKEVFHLYSEVQLKIVLSTNIGQTSITIPDLLYVIDTGRAKMKTHDAATDSSQLACDWISQSDAQQRTGRAGRRKDGICYRLYSSWQFNNFTQFVVPEIMRNTLDEICLLAKIAMPKWPVQQFLSQALDPPHPVAVVQAVRKLKMLRVLNDYDESVTQLGHILAELPLDVQLGKSLVYGIYYRCFGSLSIIAAFYSVRDPFVLPSDRNSRNEQRKPREMFKVDCYSDSLAILELYNKYVAVCRKGHYSIVNFCEENLLSRRGMDMFVSAVESLRMAVQRIIRMNDANAVVQYDEDMNMVRLALTAGLYPKIVFVSRGMLKRPQLIGDCDHNLQLSRNSSMNIMTFARKQTQADWLIYVEKTRTSENVTHIQNVTLVSGLMVAIQCGKVVNIVADLNQPVNGDEVPVPVPVPVPIQADMCIDNWIRITLEPELGKQLLSLRTHITREFNELIANRVMQPSRCPTAEYVKKMLHLDSCDSGLYAKDIVFN